MKILSILLLMWATPALAETVLLTTANTISIRSEINWKSVTKAQMELAQAVKDRGRSPYPIYLVLDSPGGSVVAGEAFIEFASNYDNVHTVSLFAASMASAIVQAMPGRRLISKSGIMMFHRASGRFQGQFETGEVESQLKLWKSVVRNMELRNARRMGLSLEKYKEEVVNEWWAHGVETKSLNMSDAVVSIECSQQLIDKQEIVETASLFGSSSEVYSACPLIRGTIK